MKLYELTAQFKQLEALIDAEGLTVEHVADTVEAMEGEIADKINACLMVYRQCKAESEQYAVEADRLLKLSNDAGKRSDSILEYVKHNMLSLGMDKLKTPLFQLTLRKPTKKLGDIDESKIDDKYFIVIPESRKLDKRLLLADAKLSEIDGVSVVDSERSLTVK